MVHHPHPRVGARVADQRQPRRNSTDKAGGRRGQRARVGTRQRHVGTVVRRVVKHVEDRRARRVAVEEGEGGGGGRARVPAPPDADGDVNAAEATTGSEAPVADCPAVRVARRAVRAGGTAAPTPRAVLKYRLTRSMGKGGGQPPCRGSGGGGERKWGGENDRCRCTSGAWLSRGGKVTLTVSWVPHDEDDNIEVSSRMSAAVRHDEGDFLLKKFIQFRGRPLYTSLRSSRTLT